MLTDRHGLLRSWSLATLVVVPECIGLRNLDIVEPVQILRSRLPVSVRGFVLEHQHERLFLIPIFLQPGQCLVANDVRCVSRVLAPGCFCLDTATEHWRIVIRPLSLKNIEIVEALRRRLEVPLSDHGSLVAGFAQKLGKGLLGTIKGISISYKSIEMAVFSSLNHGSARAANRVCDVAAREFHAALSDAVKVRSRHTGGVIR